ncbi:MAG: hypothetical protein BRD32_00015 [Bacteroidetes bacterium QH_2_64_74]|nr:MAG: hypothetical protein BRD32_00015 [Bacteroidetes bacterium QH_2_64_74]
MLCPTELRAQEVTPCGFLQGPLCSTPCSTQAPKCSCEESAKRQTGGDSVPSIRHFRLSPRRFPSRGLNSLRVPTAVGTDPPRPLEPPGPSSAERAPRTIVGRPDDPQLRDGAPGPWGGLHPLPVHPDADHSGPPDCDGGGRTVDGGAQQSGATACELHAGAHPQQQHWTGYRASNSRPAGGPAPFLRVGWLSASPECGRAAPAASELPLPESARLVEQSQLELIRRVLESDLGLVFNVVMLALVPGVCEELLFRGYAQRQFERAAGPAGGIILAGGLFGLYHLRPSQLLPLIMLGLYMAYLAWRTGSLLPAMAVHVAHNGFAVLAARYVETSPRYDLEAIEQASMPWYAVLLGFVIVGGVLYVMHTLAPHVRDE